MHSSGMRRYIPACTVAGGVPALVGGVPAQGVYTPGWVYLPGGCTCLVVPAQGVYLPGGVPAPGCVYLPRGVPAQVLPAREQND